MDHCCIPTNLCGVLRWALQGHWCSMHARRLLYAQVQFNKPFALAQQAADTGLPQLVNMECKFGPQKDSVSQASLVVAMQRKALAGLDALTPSHSSHPCPLSAHSCSFHLCAAAGAGTGGCASSRHLTWQPLLV